MGIRVLKNIKTGRYFGHLDGTYSRGVDYDDIDLAFKFDSYPILNGYKCVFYVNELRRKKFKKLNGIIQPN